MTQNHPKPFNLCAGPVITASLGEPAADATEQASNVTTYMHLLLLYTFERQSSNCIERNLWLRV